MLNQILKNLWRRKMRTALTVAGIAVGVALIVTLGALGAGMRTGYVDMFGGSGADLILMQRGAYDITLSGVDEEVVAQVAALPEVEAATGMIVGNLTAPGMPYFFVFGYALDGFASERFKVVAGEPLGTARAGGRGSRELLLGEKAAEALKLGVGDTLQLTGGTFHIRGIYATGSGFEDAAAVISLADAQQLFQKHRQVGAVQIKLKDVRQSEAVRVKLARLFPRLTASQSSEVADQQDMVSMIEGFAWGIALLAVVIGGVGMMNTVMMSTFERTREIGTLRALGWSRRRVLVMVLGESLALGLVGGAVGCVAGAALLYPLSQQPALSFLQGRLSAGLLVQGLVTAVLLGAVGGLYPAGWASRLLPVEAMRYEGGSGEQRLATLPIKSQTLRMLWRRRGRTLLTVLGISIGLAAVITLGGLTKGFIREFNRVATTSDVDLMVRQAGSSDIGYSAIDERVGRQIAALPGVKSVSGLIIGMVTLEHAPTVPFFIVMGYAPHEPAIQHFTIVEGRGLVGNWEIIMGRPAATMLKTRVGQTIRLGESNFRVVGLYETGTAWEESGGVISLRDAQQLLGKPRQVTLYGIKLESLQDVALIRRQIEAMPGLAVSLSTEFTETMPEMQNLNVMMGAISALAILVGGIGMMNTVFMSVFERTREIGTLRALGWRRRRVLGMVLRESVALSLLGVVGGLLLSLLLSALLRQLPAWGGWLVVIFSWGLVAQALGIALGLGAVGGAYPAWRASRLSPVEALRYE
jgi:ABC-type antimicrobial peptide transport system permease subunit